MAKIQPEEIVDHLDSAIRKILERTVRQVMPDADVEPYGLFRAFKREIRRNCDSWVEVPDRFVKEAK